MLFASGIQAYHISDHSSLAKGVRINNSRVITIAVAIGMFISTLDTGIINIAIPTFVMNLHTTLSYATLTVTIYTFFLCISILIFGVIADRCGRVKIYQYGLWLFLLSSLLCGISNNIILLVVFRGLQGLSAAMLQATAISIVTTLVSGEHRNKSLGLIIAFAGAGPIVGPAVGGFLISMLSWKAIFFINIPICIVGLYLCTKFNDNLSYGKSAVNRLSMALIVLSIASFILTGIALSETFFPRVIYKIGFIVTILMIIISFIHEMKSETAIISRKYILNANVTSSLLALFSMGFGAVIVFMLTPIYLTVFFQFQPFEIGFIALIAPVGMMMLSKISHLFIAKFTARAVLISGLILMSLSLFLLSLLSSVSYLLYLSALLFLFGVGCGLLQPSATILLMSQIEKPKHSIFSSLSRMSVNTAIATGAIVTSVLVPSVSVHLSIHFLQRTWLLSAVFSFLSFVVISAMLTAVRFRKAGLDPF